MDPQVQALIGVVQLLVDKVGVLTDKVDGLLCHFTSIDADYVRMRSTLRNHEDRLLRLEAPTKTEADADADAGAAKGPPL